MKSNTEIVRVIDGNSMMDGSDMSMASLGDSNHHQMAAPKRHIDDDSSGDNDSGSRPPEEAKDELVPIPEEEEVKEVITPQKEDDDKHLAAPARAHHKRIDTISEAPEDDEASQAHKSAHASLGEPFNPYIDREIRNSNNVESELNQIQEEQRSNNSSQEE